MHSPSGQNTTVRKQDMQARCTLHRCMDRLQGQRQSLSSDPAMESHLRKKWQSEEVMNLPDLFWKVVRKGQFLYNSLSRSLKYDLWLLWVISFTTPYQHQWNMTYDCWGQFPLQLLMKIVEPCNAVIAPTQPHWSSLPQSKPKPIMTSLAAHANMKTSHATTDWWHVCLLCMVALSANPICWRMQHHRFSQVPKCLEA